MKDFVFAYTTPRVIFGAGSIGHLEREIKQLGANRALILCTSRQRPLAEKIAGIIGIRCAGIFDRAAMHVPVETARIECFR